MTEDLVGKRLGKYQIQAALGKGGMGMVYLGYDPLLDRKVAIKILAPHLVWEEGFVERFLREARAVAKIKHPNIVTVYDVGQEQERYFFVMEYLEGQTLANHIRQQGALPPEEVLSLLYPLADALDYAHQHGLVHRDIKPGNIIIGSGKRVTLTDFGIAKAAEESRLTATGTLMGTPQYMSPEQAWGEEIGYQTDLYSLAVVAYEMLSGQVPFSGTTPHAVLYKQIHEPPPPICQSRPELPEGIEPVLARALDKEPTRRHATATAFVAELDLALAGNLVTTPEDAPTELIAADQGAKAVEQVAPAAVSHVQKAAAHTPLQAASVPPSAASRQAPAKPHTAKTPRVPTVIWVLGALGVLAILAGVIGIIWLSGGDSDGPAPAASTQTSVAATEVIAQPTATREVAGPPVSEEPTCSDPAGCVVIGSDAPILIGVMLPLSGDRQDLGISALHGIELAAGGKRDILGHPIEIAAEDSVCAEEGAMRAAEALISNPRIVSVIGSSCPGDDYGPVQYLCAESVPLISPSSLAPELTSPDRPGEFGCFLRTAAAEDVRAEIAAEFAWNSGMRRAATIQDEGILPDNLVQRFSQRFQELGGEIVAQAVLGPENLEVPPLLERLAESQPQLLYAPVYVERGAEIASFIRKIPPLREVQLLGADGMFTPRYLAATGEVAVGTFLSAPDVERVGPGYFEFLLVYEEALGEPPRAPLWAPAHDAAMMIFAAIQDVAQRLDDGSLIIGRAALLERLFATRNFKGLTGNLSCAPSGQCGSPSAAIYEIVSPDPAHWHPGAGPDDNPRRIWP